MPMMFLPSLVMTEICVSTSAVSSFAMASPSAPGWFQTPTHAVRQPRDRAFGRFLSVAPRVIRVRTVDRLRERPKGCARLEEYVERDPPGGRLQNISRTHPYNGAKTLRVLRANPSHRRPPLPPPV